MMFPPAAREFARAFHPRAGARAYKAFARSRGLWRDEFHT